MAEAERLYEKLQSGPEADRWWRELVSLEIRADSLYWIVNLAEAAIEARKEEWIAANKERGISGLEGSEVASICSWKVDLKEFVDQIIKKIDNPAPAKKGKKKSK